VEEKSRRKGTEEGRPALQVGSSVQLKKGAPPLRIREKGNRSKEKSQWIRRGGDRKEESHLGRDDKTGRGKRPAEIFLGRALRQESRAIGIKKPSGPVLSFGREKSRGRKDRGRTT